MNTKLNALTLLALFLSGGLFAAEPLSPDAIKRLLTNNTMSCKNLQKNEMFTNYYRDDGSVTKLTSTGEKIQGTWHVTDDGQHCHDWENNEEDECCHPIYDQGNGIYQRIEDDKPKAEFTVTEGNPKNL
jgi:hypothetical protein